MADISASPQLQPFHLAVPGSVLEDLRHRLSSARWPIDVPGPAWALGTDAGFLHSLVQYWLNDFDWRAHEARLNSFPQFIAHTGALDVHVVVERGSGDAPLPLILTHGWPGSPFELLPLVEPLAHPERHGGSIDDAFTVVLPSLPGFGLSPAPASLLTPRSLAEAWHRLMHDVLGFPRYVAHGGDTGATITSWMGLDADPRLPAIHLNTAVLFADWTFAESPLDASEQTHLERQRQRLAGEDAYQALHAEKPATLSFALADSPLGLAAWIVEKFHGWTTQGATTLSAITADQLILNIMPYWLGRAHPAHWLYQSLRDMTGYRLPPGQRIQTPTGLCLFPNDIVVPAPRRWLERSYNLASLTLPAAGGHFPGLEHPEILIQDLRRFFRPYRPGAGA